MATPKRVSVKRSGAGRPVKGRRLDALKDILDIRDRIDQPTLSPLRRGLKAPPKLVGRDEVGCATPVRAEGRRRRHAPACSNAFEPTTGGEKAKPLLGLAKYADRLRTSLLDIAYAPAWKVSHSTLPGGFDNDPATLNDILGRSVGPTPARLFSTSDLDY